MLVRVRRATMLSQAEDRDRQHEVAPGTGFPAGNRQPVEVHPEQQPQQRQQHERRHRNAGDREHHGQLIRERASAQRRERTDRGADTDRDQHRKPAEHHAHGQTLGDQVRDAEVRIAKRRSEIAVGQRTQIAKVLPPKRLIHAVGRLEVADHVGCEIFLLIQGAAGRCAHQEKADGHDREQRGNGTA
jgi:hypothetical protein